jgi:hypothetical protein
MINETDENKMEEFLKEIEINFRKIDFLTLTESFFNLDVSEKNLKNATNLLADSSKIVFKYLI